MTAIPEAGPAVLPARSLDEVLEYLALRPCACAALAPPGPDLAIGDLGEGYHRLAYACPACGQPRAELVLLTERPGQPGEEFAYARSGQPSRLLDGGDWAAVVRRHYATAQLLLPQLAQVPLDERLAGELAIELTRAAAAAEEALARLPEGADELPASEAGTDAGRALREEHPELFARPLLEYGPVRCRERLTEVIGAYQERLGCPGTRLERLIGEALPYGTRPGALLPRARTYWEALYHSRTVACRCGGQQVATRQDTLTVDGDLVTRLFGACDACGRPREFRYQALADRGGALPMDAAWAVDERPSELFDPAAFAALAAVLGEIGRSGIPALQTMAEPLDQWLGIRHHLWLAAEAAQQALAGLPPGAPRLPAQQVWTAMGREHWEQSPQSLERAALERQWEQAKRALAEFTARYPRPAGDDLDDLDGW